MKFLAYLCLSFAFACAALAEDPHAGHSTPPAKVAPPPAKPSALFDERAAVDVPPSQQAKMGLKVSQAKKEKLEHTIRTVGTITADQTREAHVHTKINGWVEKIYADYIGKPVKRGQPLLELYSPDLVSTQEEYLSAKRQGSGEIAKAALERLSLWGVPQKEVERIKRQSSASRSVAFHSPVDGVIVNKAAIQGMYVTPEMELYHIADLSRVWILVTLYEYDLAAVSKGDVASLELPFQPGKKLKGSISYVYPEVEMETRTAKARIEMENPDRALKPGMFTNVEIRKNLGESITVPDEAVMDTGTRKIVFVKSGPARFEPREVATGPRVGNSFVILSGIKPGDEVVTSAHFLIDAESKFQAATKRGAAQPAGHGEHGGK